MSRKVAKHVPSISIASPVHLLKRPCARSILAACLATFADVPCLARPFCGFCCKVIFVAPSIFELAQAEKPWTFAHNSTTACHGQRRSTEYCQPQDAHLYKRANKSIGVKGKGEDCASLKEGCGIRSERKPERSGSVFVVQWFSLSEKKSGIDRTFCDCKQVP